MEPQENFIQVEKTARYHTLGIAGPHVRQVWFVLHGYGQLSKYFIRHFQAILEPDVLVIAPEGLSRFYIPPGWTRVGASWMTREARTEEIDDYVAYLDNLLGRISNLVPEDAQVILAGFSQGATTAWRWATMGKVRPAAFVNWSGSVPEECLKTESGWETQCRMVYVRASEDEYISPDQSSTTIAFLKSRNEGLQVFDFNGNHRMDETTLLKVAELLR